VDAPERFSAFWQLDAGRGHPQVDTRLVLSTVYGLPLALTAALVIMGLCCHGAFAPCPIVPSKFPTQPVDHRYRLPAR
jgi:hypothetical protein